MAKAKTQKLIKTGWTGAWLTVQKIVENMVYVYETPDAPVHISHVTAALLFSEALGRWVIITAPTITDLQQ